MKRRDFVRALGGLAAGSVASLAGAQAPAGTTDAPEQSSSNLFPMDQQAARSVRRPPKPNAKPLLDNDERDAVERQLRCQCGCTLDIFTCRTTDFSCQVSPAMHRDVVALVEGGYSAEEIVAAFTDGYGEKVLMAPPKRGFNLLGWTMPFAVLAVGGTMLAVLLRRWRRRAEVAATSPGAQQVPRVSTGDATADELARLDAAVRDGA
ncbi:MAG TPA: cytochrome c-type biogenesis protein CcmH [Gemmatimonadaceae bacterium]|nr:cytochrome c-type biogenesis protein CcmH [Gemmatimonadaceae bacterium]